MTNVYVLLLNMYFLPEAPFFFGQSELKGRETRLLFFSLLPSFPQPLIFPSVSEHIVFSNTASVSRQHLHGMIYFCNFSLASSTALSFLLSPHISTFFILR